MSVITGLPRVCFENCIVKDHLNVNGTAEFRKDVNFKGKVTFGNGTGSVCFGNPILADQINELTENAGVTVDGVLLKDGQVIANKATLSEICGTGGGDLCVSSVMKVNNIQEKTVNSGVTVDGVIMKDNDVCADEVQVDTLTRKSEGDAISVDGSLCVDNEVQVNYINEKTMNWGVTIEGILHKDNYLCADEARIDTLKKKSGSAICVADPLALDVMKAKSGSAVTLEGGLDMSGRLGITQTCINVPSAEFPTIQSAINYADNRHAGCLKIKIAKGQYIEDLKVVKTAGSINEPASDTTAGFNMVGDERHAAARSFVHDQEIANDNGDAGLGLDGDIIVLSGGASTITVGGSTVNFATAGVIIGDHIKIRDDGGIWETRPIVSVSGNTLTYDGASVTVGGFMSALTICPCVEVLPATGFRTGAQMFLNAAVAIKGIWFNLDTNRGAAFGFVGNLFADRSHINTTYCLFDDSEQNSFFANIYLLLGTIIDNLKEEFNFLFGENTIIGGGVVGFEGPQVTLATCHFFESGGRLGDANVLTILDSQIINASVGFNADTCELNTRRNQLVGCTRGATFRACSGDVIGNTIDCSSDGSTPNVGSAGIVVKYSNISIDGEVKNAEQGVILYGGASVLDTDMTYTNCGVDAIRSATSAYEKSSLPNDNILDYSVAGPLVMNGNFENQTLTGAPGAVALTMDPSAVSSRSAPDDIQVYIGKKYKLMSKTAAAHTLTLDAGTFVGCGLGGSDTVATFKSVNSFLVLLTIDATTVMVCNYCEIDFDITPAGSFPVIKKVAPQLINAGSNDAISIATYATLIINSAIGGSNSTHTMADGNCLNQLKVIRFKFDGGSATITPTNFSNGTNIVVTGDADEILTNVELIWDGSTWIMIDQSTDLITIT
jgi:hypothetical protein